jgi:hypothetical protein
LPDAKCVSGANVVSDNVDYALSSQIGHHFVSGQ